MCSFTKLPFSYATKIQIWQSISDMEYTIYDSTAFKLCTAVRKACAGKVKKVKN